MGINLQKGQKIDLSKGGAGGSGLRRVMVGLGWDEAPRSGGGLFGLRQPQPIDCDASVILCGANGRSLALTSSSAASISAICAITAVQSLIRAIT